LVWQYPKRVATYHKHAINETAYELTPAVNPVDLNLGDFSYAA